MAYTKYFCANDYTSTQLFILRCQLINTFICTYFKYNSCRTIIQTSESMVGNLSFVLIIIDFQNGHICQKRWYYGYGCQKLKRWSILETDQNFYVYTKNVSEICSPFTLKRKAIFCIQIQILIQIPKFYHSLAPLCNIPFLVQPLPLIVVYTLSIFQRTPWNFLCSARCRINNHNIGRSKIKVYRISSF